MTWKPGAKQFMRERNKHKESASLLHSGSTTGNNFNAYLFSYTWKAELDTHRAFAGGEMKQTERERVFHPLLHFPNACNSRSWARLKPRDLSSIWDSHVAGPLPITSQMHKQGAGFEAELFRWNQHCDEGWGCPKCISSVHYAVTPTTDSRKNLKWLPLAWTIFLISLLFHSHT